MAIDERATLLAAQMNKEMGEGSVMVASEMHIPRRFTSGSLSLDLSIGGGWPGNQWVEIYGPENHGKTAIVLKTIAANQALDSDFTTFWVASEHYELDQARALGVDTDRVIVLSTRDMVDAYTGINRFLDERATDCVVLDSYPALIPPDEDSKGMDEYTQAEGARMTNKFFRKVGKAGLRNPKDPDDRPWFGMFVNQPREKIGGWAPNGGTPETTPGGRGKNFSFYCRLDVKRAEWIEEVSKSSKTKVGQVIRTRAIKNKGGPPQRVATMDFYFTDAESGFRRGQYDLAKDALIPAVLFDVVHRSGAWYTYGDKRWQGLSNVLDDVRADDNLLAAIYKETYERASSPRDKRTWDEDDIERAAAEPTVVRRRKPRVDPED